MSKENGTAASQAHAPEEGCSGVYPHATSYPGRKTPKAQSGEGGAPHEQSTQEAGRKASLGVSANGSHKGLPAEYSYVGHKSGPLEKDAPMKAAPSAASKVAHDGAAQAAGMGNSMGTSADGSHKGVPTSKEQVGQRS